MEFGGHRTQRRSAPGATGALIAPHDAVAADRPQVEARDLEGAAGGAFVFGELQGKAYRWTAYTGRPLKLM